MTKYKINGKRLIKNLFDMAQFGMNEKGGIDRTLGSQADYDTRKWIEKYWGERLKLTCDVDAIANIWGEKNGKENLLPIVIGSHHDAVPDGGKYDGSMGVLIATEVMESILENDIRLRHPLKLISFTGEEPNPYDFSTLGSKVISGRLGIEDLEKSSHRETGESLRSCIARLGGNIDELEKARIMPGNIAAFLEVHNELGGYLESKNASVSGVSTITGIYREAVRAVGESNHAGTTMMQDRKDAFLAMGELAVEMDKATRNINNPHVVATMGYVKLTPNEANIIPGITESIVDIRAVDRNRTQQIIDAMSETIEQIEEKRHVKFIRKCILDQPARIMDADIAQIVHEEIESNGEQALDTVSMAGHDAANMQLITKSGMIFVKSIGGKGHCREEYSKEEDIVKAAQVAMNVIIRLDRELD